MTLQPILTAIKGTPDFVLSINPQFPNELFVFLGMALLERVPRLTHHIAYKMLLARLYNAGVKVKELVKCFGVAHTTLRRWGLALKSGDMERINRAFSGQGAHRKVTPEIERYVADRFHELYGTCREYSKQIRKEVKDYFTKTISRERLRWIFKAEREKLEEEERARSEGEKTEGDKQERANSCESEEIEIDIEGNTASTANNSLRGEMIYSGQRVPEEPKLYHHAGLVLLSPWLDEVTGDIREDKEIIRQWFCQVLQGAVNHEQSKRLSFSSMDFLVGPTVRSIHYQRSRLGEVASYEKSIELLKCNGRLLEITEEQIFYYDPHVKEYTGILKILKGWCGNIGGIRKVMNMDFIHTLKGEPCFVQHFDNYYDMRERFFMCRASFRRVVGVKERPMTWIVDRGMYSLKALGQVMDTGDAIIIWEKGYAGDGWDEKQNSGSFTRIRKRNYAEDVLVYRFMWQESEWEKDSRMRRIIVRALNPNGTLIEVSILASDKRQKTEQIIEEMFSRWIQENDFWYLGTHFGINELTSRVYERYSEEGEGHEDREVESREYKRVMKEKQQIELSLSRLLMKEKKQERRGKKKREEWEAKLEGMKAESAKLGRQLKEAEEKVESDETDKGYKEIERKKKKSEKAVEQLVAKRSKEEEKGKEKQRELAAHIGQKNEELEEIENELADTVRKESRLQALIEEQYLRIDTRKKAYMDMIRISCRNIFYGLLGVFRPLYDNYRDDHMVLRELTRSMGIVKKRDGQVIIELLPAMEFPPKVRRIVREFLQHMNERINRHFAGRYLPVQIRLVANRSEILGEGRKNE